MNTTVQTNDAMKLETPRDPRRGLRVKSGLRAGAGKKQEYLVVKLEDCLVTG